MIVIAIDDQPNKYISLSETLSAYNVTLICMQNPVSIKMAFEANQIIGVLLSGWDCEHTARNILPSTTPLVIISTVHKDAAKETEIILEERSIPFKTIPANDPKHYIKWLKAILASQDWDVSPYSTSSR